jgi:TPR repeat protein
MKYASVLLALLVALSACSTPTSECRSPTYLPIDLTQDQGVLGPNDYDAAIRRLRTRAHYDPQARYLLGLMFEEGIGVDADREIAASLYLRAGRDGDAKAQFRYAYMIWEGITWSSTDSERYDARDIFSYASKEITELARSGDAEAQYMLGYLYGTGKAFPIDREEAGKWYLKAAEQRHAVAQYALGDYYKKRDEREALKWFRRSAENGYADAQFFLGDAYRWGVHGVSPDKVEAMTWYSVATANGHAGAAYARDELAKKMTPEELTAASQRSGRSCTPQSQAT